MIRLKKKTKKKLNMQSYRSSLETNFKNEKRFDDDNFSYEKQFNDNSFSFENRFNDDSLRNNIETQNVRRKKKRKGFFFNRKLKKIQKRKDDILSNDLEERNELYRLLDRDIRTGGRLIEYEVDFNEFLNPSKPSSDRKQNYTLTPDGKRKYKKEDLTLGLFVSLLGEKIKNKAVGLISKIEKIKLPQFKKTKIGAFKEKSKHQKEEIFENKYTEEPKVTEKITANKKQSFEKKKVYKRRKKTNIFVSIFNGILNGIFNFSDKYVYETGKKFLNNYSRPLKRLRLKLATATCITTIFLITGSFAWFYEEYLSKGTLLTVGNIECSIKQYDINGNFLTNVDNTSTIIYENNISNITKNSRFIEITNTGSLDMKYDLTFALDSTVATTGILYYRIYDVTAGVKAATPSEGQTKLQKYALSNPLPSNLESDLSIPVANMSTISSRVISGTIELDEVNLENNTRYYRLDYGMYSTVNTSIYSGNVISVHMQGFAYQTGMISGGLTGGAVWAVENETQLRSAIASAMAGDTIKLIDNISVEGTINVDKRISFDTNSYTLNVTGDFVFDFVDIGDLVISTQNGGKINVASNLYMNTPKTRIHFMGTNEGYDIFVGDTVTLNGLQNDEEDGVLIENTSIIKNTVGNIPADLNIMSNTRLTIGPNVSVGNVIAVPGSTNIEILNNGSIVQILLSDMELLNTFTKAQIYIYNLNTILGIVGGDSIVLPASAVPYRGPGIGNTLIVRGVNSTDITVSGAEGFTQNDIEYVNTVEDVVPIIGEDNAYIVYIRESTASLEGLLVEYFTKESSTNISGDIAAIKKLMIFTVNAQYLENEDFAFMRSTNMPALENLDISNARTIDRNIINRIPNGAMLGKTSLTKLTLPKTVTVIGDNAFADSPLGKIPISGDFQILSIPQTVTNIGANAFAQSRYIQFEGYIPPSIEADTFTFDLQGARLFVYESVIPDYQSTENYNRNYIHQNGILSDDKNYFVHVHGASSVGISLIVATGNVGNELSIPATIMYLGNSFPVSCIGSNSYSHITTPNTGTDLIIPNTVNQIGNRAFYNKTINSVNLSNVRRVDDFAFYNADIKTLNLNNATYVGDYSFYSNNNLIYASMESLNKIGDYAFADTDLYEVNFGSVQEMGEGVLENVEYLQAMYFTTTETIIHYSSEIIKINALDGNLFNPNWINNTGGRVRIYVPNGKSNLGTPYTKLYSNIFSGYEDYIYITGTQFGSYQHMAINYDYHEYSIIRTEYTDASNNVIQGVKIIEYHGADLPSNYEIPAYFTLDGINTPVIEIGERAYLHVKTEPNANISITHDSIYAIRSKAFKGATMGSFKGEYVEVIEDSAFENAVINKIVLPNLLVIGKSAFANMADLYMIDIGNAYQIGEKALSNLQNVQQIFWNRTSTSEIDIKADSFEELGNNTRNRLRIYVPTTKVSFYKGLIERYEKYIYMRGEIIGSFINVPIQYDIGEYSVRTVTKLDGNGDEVTGYEIIEYHGADFPSNYNIPLELTVNHITKDVISIGQSAFIHSKSESGIAADLVSDTLLEIDDYAFNGVKGINSLESESLVRVGEYAFNNSSLEYVIIPYVDQVESYAFANMSTLYKIDLGYVRELSANALYNLDNLYQVFFEPVDNVLFDPYSITNVGSLTNNRIRFYVGAKETEDIVQILTPYTLTVSTNDTYTTRTSTNNTGNWINPIYNNVRTDIHTTTITLTNNNDVPVDNWSFDVGISVTPVIPTNSTSSATITLNSVTGLDYEWDGATVSFRSNDSNSHMVQGATLRATINWTTVITQISQPGFLGSNPGVPNPTVDVSATTPKSSHIQTITTVIKTKFDSIYKTYFRREYEEYFYPRGTIGGSFTPTAIDYDIGAYTTFDAMFTDMDGYTRMGQELIEYHGANIRSSFQIPETINVDGEVQDVIRIGDYAFKFATMTDGQTFNVVSDNLYEIGVSAFENLKGVKMVYCSKLQSVGAYAFFGNKIEQVTLPDIRVVGEYSFSDNLTMYYLDLGKITNIKANAFRGNTNIAQIFFKSTAASAVSQTVDIAIGENAFAGVGASLSNRLRVYVPIGTIGTGVSYATCYRNTLPANLASYVYITGTIIGSYEPGVIPFDIGEYSARTVTITNVDGESITGAEIIEYHAADIDANYSFPTTVQLGGVTYNVISYGDHSFANTTFTENRTLELSQNMLNIGERAFYNKPITSLTGNKITKIGKYAFAECANLELVEFEATKTVDDYAFYMCPILKDVYLGFNVEYIGSYALYYTYTTQERNLYLQTEIPPRTGESPFPERLPRQQGRYTYYIYSFYIYVPGASLTTYRNTSPYSGYTGVISGYQLGEQHVLSYATAGGYMYDIINTNEIEILSYRDQAGGNITIPESMQIDGQTYRVTSIKANAFDATTTVTGITIPRYVNNIETGFLNNNTSIETINVVNNNQYFSAQNGVLYNKNRTILIRYPPQKGDYQFNMPNTVQVIAKDAFSYNESLNSLILSNGLIVVDKDAFRYCTNMRFIQFTNEDVPYITGFGLLDTCLGLEEIYVPQNTFNNYKNSLFLRKYNLLETTW